jgi:hypothetical protein
LLKDVVQNKNEAVSEASNNNLVIPTTERRRPPAKSFRQESPEQISSLSKVVLPKGQVDAQEILNRTPFGITLVGLQAVF